MPDSVFEGMNAAAVSRAFLILNEVPDLALEVLQAQACLCLDLFQHCAQDSLQHTHNREHTLLWMCSCTAI